MHLPSTKDLRAFELAARLGSIKAAADQLHVSPSALSRRIQSLEEELGQALFVRDVRGITLTDIGRNYAEHLRKVFMALENATSAARIHEKQRLKVVAPSTVTAAIMPRLESFEQSMPEIDLELHQHVLQDPNDQNIQDAEIVFSWGEGNWEGWDNAYISPNCHLVPLCLPQMLNHGELFSTEEIAQHTWIVAIPFDEGWKRWYAALGIPLPKPNRIVRVSNGQMAVEAALHGQGIMMGHGFDGLPPTLTCMGLLTPAHAFHALAPNFGFHLHTRLGSANPAIGRFRTWFSNEVWNTTVVQKFIADYRRQNHAA